ncbi:VF530 family DNA-binding protein [Ottowia thiooxydans]|uniref:VF530 family protein n=1 Tax=Ottowia thiooxydans TaxID=219182 RepID=UPI0004911551|nr:VF530 family protein [Ottowia thiooxydans]
MNEASPPAAQPKNPLHGVTLEAMVRALEAQYGWAGLAERIPVRCFSHDPGVNSSLKFLRKTPWAREKVEGLYLFMLREQKRMQRPDY